MSRCAIFLVALCLQMATSLGAVVQHSHNLRADPKKNEENAVKLSAEPTEESAKEKLAEKAAEKSAEEAAAGKDGEKKGYDWSKMPLKAQEQGYSGKKVKHSDGKTASADWQNEYGNPE
mmetsp:Transcript_85849/g.135559  ORF Transcript_85849/g.135559 Transcript_85849/m.135559 type:complete len:119 (+) Transcript_85849:60-416(+)|eukprot:CAMPEP_0169262252 /NCGR_PEP_ID=MMETSP1016-20121227/43594_1 /TAXON_ID=342587 /ORGANISM="Karlodinium micrum, Strain CCMP2283" /LENGTH=118 /DNA_ID=CAMNT_0009344737 /DNA_START=15 /DNA_END=371 /DNA_ORIENTATION=+